MFDRKSPGRFWLLAGILVITVLTLSGPAAAEYPKGTVLLNAGEAQRVGSLIHKWGKWVVWCGHNICDGTYTWRFPKRGRFALIWTVGQKCAGSAPYRLDINDNEVISGRIPQRGGKNGCNGCTPQNIVNNPGGKYGGFIDIEFGTFNLRKGDKVALWVRNDFACGINNPGHYAYYDHVRAEPRPD